MSAMNNFQTLASKSWQCWFTLNWHRPKHYNASRPSAAIWYKGPHETGPL